MPFPDRDRRQRKVLGLLTSLLRFEIKEAASFLLKSRWLAAEADELSIFIVTGGRCGDCGVESTMELQKLCYQDIDMISIVR